jgi:hypothetical protein
VNRARQAEGVTSVSERDEVPRDQKSVMCSWSRFVQADGIKIVVEPLVFYQLRVGSFFDQRPFVQDQNSVGSLNRRESVGDDEGRAPYHEALEGLLDETLRIGIER